MTYLTYYYELSIRNIIKIRLEDFIIKP